MKRPPPGSVLLIIDLQRAIDHPSWGVRNHPDAEQKVGELLAYWDLEALAARCDRLLAAGTMPEPTDDWHVIPWPPF